MGTYVALFRPEQGETSKVKHCETSYGRLTTPEISELFGERLILLGFRSAGAQPVCLD
jgi:hypothetical protein